MNDSILDAVGSPLVRVGSPRRTTVAAKLEASNPGGSAKSRPAVAMVEAAEAAGDLEPGDGIVEPTSGNTGIGLAMAGAAKGYDVRLVMPASKSPERREVMRAYGAEIDLVEGDISDAKERADRLEREAGYVQMQQFANPANPKAHYRTTGVEVLEQVGDRTIDALVAGVGTGGTISGVARRLRESVPDLRVVAVEPAGNAVLEGDGDGTVREGSPADDDGTASDRDGFQGMGPGFVSPNLDLDLLDGVERVSLDAATVECRRLAREEGILVGQSSGASNLAARRVAAELAGHGDPTPVTGANERDRVDGTDGPLVVTVFWDSGERYLSTGLFESERPGNGIDG